ncbi:MAG: phosphohydrolase [Leptolyngbya sp. SIO1D8]|nr:phosphohydrolase [Leptolyngbya sp. SIO1D8]
MMNRTYPDAWIQTYIGKAFYPLEPAIEDIDIIDIAWSLSHQCRYAGHCKRFYSVAEHSLWLVQVAPTPYKRWALLHDAAETYLVDVPRPIKFSLGNYKRIEERLMYLIAEKFELEWPEPFAIEELDYRILEDERLALMGSGKKPWTTGNPLGISSKTSEFSLTPEKVFQNFLETYKNLEGRKSQNHENTNSN